MTDSPRWSRLAHFLAWFVVGGLVTLVIVILLWRGIVGQASIPPLTARIWRDSREKWQLAAVRNYDLQVAVTGRQAATYAVQVRDGQVTGATRDGQPLPQQRTWATWSVEGMFETIARDLDSVEKHATGRADSTTPQLRLRASFHPEFGFPQRYLRTEIVRVGANPEVSWQVIRFERR